MTTSPFAAWNDGGGPAQQPPSPPAPATTDAPDPRTPEAAPAATFEVTAPATPDALVAATPDAPVVPAPVSPAAPVPAQPVPAQPVPDVPAPDLPVPLSPAPGTPPAAPTEPADPLPLAAATAVVEEIEAELSAQAAPETAARPAPEDHGEWRGIVIVTGTDTDVGKTIVTSAIAAAAQAAGLRVAVVKPGQTGIAQGGPTDVELITRLAGPDTARTLASYPEPLAPLAAARVAHEAPLELYTAVDAIRAEAEKHDLVLVEGAGGLLVPMGVRPSGDPWTVADLATTLGARAIVVARAGLGTLNHTALTLEALSRRGVPAGVVLGAWPAEPELVHWANFSELASYLVGALPDGAGAMEPGVFRRSAPGWLTPALYGVLDDWRAWADEAH